MADHNNYRSGAKTAEDLARFAKAVYNIVKAAITTGPEGAAVAAVKEALPFLIKLAVGVVFVLLIIPTIIFTALPNIFFGFESSDTDSIISMSEQAMTIGGVYISIEDYEREQIDSAVTSIVASHEEEGITVDSIVVNNSMREDDLLWLIAINSAAYQQDLDAMSVDRIREFCQSRISYIPTLGIEMSGDISITTLEVEVERLDPEELMDELEFDEDTRIWAGALYEVLKESDAINKYADYFDAYRPNYGGDSSYTGDVQYGTEYENEIDISDFTDPSTKNNLDLAAYAIMAWENNWGYVWGTYGSILTESLFEYKKEQYPDGVGNHAEFIESNWLGRRTADCIGLIKGYGWLDASDMTIGYAENGMPDYGANQMYQWAKDTGAINEDYGAMDTMPEMPGLMLWKDGHVGVYIGDGYAIEAMSTQKGIVKTEVDERGWQGWCKLPCIEYTEEGV